MFYPFDPLHALPLAHSPSGVAQCNFNTINQKEVPTFSPSLIKIRPIVRYKPLKRDRQIDTHKQINRSLQTVYVMIIDCIYPRHLIQNFMCNVPFNSIEQDLAALR